MSVLQVRGGTCKGVGVYVDDLLVTGTDQCAVEEFVCGDALVVYQLLWVNGQVPRTTI